MTEGGTWMEKEDMDRRGAARAILWTDTVVIATGEFDFSGRAGRGEPDAGDLEAIAGALFGAKNEDDAFFACLDAAARVGAAAPKGRADVAYAYDPSQGEAKLTAWLAGFADVTADRFLSKACAGVSAAIANGSTKRLAALAEDEDGNECGYVLEPGEILTLRRGRAFGRAPLAKGKKENGRETFPVPYAYEFEWRDERDGRWRPATEVSFTETEARVPDESEFPRASSADPLSGAWPRVLDGVFHRRGAKLETLKYDWKWKNVMSCRLPPRCEAERADAAAEAEAAGRVLATRDRGDGKTAAEKAAKERARCDVVFNGEEWKPTWNLGRARVPSTTKTYVTAEADAEELRLDDLDATIPAGDLAVVVGRFDLGRDEEEP